MNNKFDSQEEMTRAIRGLTYNIFDADDVTLALDLSGCMPLAKMAVEMSRDQILTLARQILKDWGKPCRPLPKDAEGGWSAASQPEAGVADQPEQNTQSAPGHLEDDTRQPEQQGWSAAKRPEDDDMGRSSKERGWSAAGRDDEG